MDTCLSRHTRSNPVWIFKNPIMKTVAMKIQKSNSFLFRELRDLHPLHFLFTNLSPHSLRDFISCSSYSESLWPHMWTCWSWRFLTQICKEMKMDLSWNSLGGTGDSSTHSWRLMRHSALSVIFFTFGTARPTRMSTMRHHIVFYSISWGCSIRLSWKIKWIP